MPGRRPPPVSPPLPGLAAWNPDEANEWYTPPAIFDALGIRFDLDPCAPPGGVPWIPVDRSLSRVDDGLATPWVGRVWLNPPYGKPTRWIEKMASHGDGIALLPVDTSTAAWHDLIAPTFTAGCFLRGRPTFVAGSGARENASGGWTSRFPVGLFGWGDAAAEAVSACGLGWVVDQGPRDG